MWSNMRRKNRLRGRKAHKTALLNKALKALQEKGDLSVCEVLEKFNVKVEELEFHLRSSNVKEFLQLPSYQNEINQLDQKHEIWPSKSDTSDLLSSSNGSTKEIYVAPQIKIENGCHIKIEETDETTQEGYDGELNSDGELADPLSYMSIKLEPTDDLSSTGNLYNSIDVVLESPSEESEKTDKLLSFSGLVNQDEEIAYSNDSTLDQTKTEASTINAIAKQNLNDIDPEISSTVSETNSEPSNKLLDLSSVYHIIKDTDSSLTCKFVKTEILKSSSIFEEEKHLEQNTNSTKGELLGDIYDYESDSTLPIDEDYYEQHKENTESKEDCDIPEEIPHTKPLYHEGTSLLVEGFADSNSSSVLSTVEGDYTSYEDLTFVQVNEEALMKRLVFREPSEGELSDSDSFNGQESKREIPSSEPDGIKSNIANFSVHKQNSIKKEPTVEEISVSIPKTEPVTIKNESNEEDIFTSESKAKSVIEEQPSTEEISVPIPKTEPAETKNKSNEENHFTPESKAESLIEEQPSDIESSDSESNIKPKLINSVRFSSVPDTKPHTVTKQFSIKVERIECNEKYILLQETSFKDTLFTEEADTGIKKDPAQSRCHRKKEKNARKRRNIEKQKFEMSNAKKSKLDEFKPKHEINQLMESKPEITQEKVPKSELIQLKMQRKEITEPKKQNSEITEVLKLKRKKINDSTPKLVESKKPKHEMQNLNKIQNLKLKIGKNKISEEDTSASLYVRPKRRKLSFQEKLDEPTSSFWDSELLPDPSTLSTVGIKKIKQMKVKQKKQPLGTKSKDTSHKKLIASMASAKQRLAKNLCLLSAPIQKFNFSKPQIKSTIKLEEKCKTEIDNDDSVNELEQIIDALSAKDEPKSLTQKVKNEDNEEIEIGKIKNTCQLPEPISVPIINNALLQEILSTGFINFSGDTQIYIEPVKPRYRVVIAPPPFPLPSVPFNLDYLVSRIGSWNVSWLEEQTANLEPPPDITVYVRNPLLSYVCYDEYFDIYYPFLMLEIWQFMFESWKKRLYNNESLISASVISHEIEDDVLILQCKAIVDGHTTISDFPFEGHLVILNISVHGCENQAQLFGYVTDHSVEQLFRADCNQEKPSNEYVIVYLTIKTRVRMGNPDFKRVIMIENLCLFKFYVLEFEALINLPKNELACSILRPQEIGYLSKQDKPFLSLGSYSAEQQNTILELSQLINSSEPNVSFISGAPGSGKTHTLVGLVQQLLCEDGHNHNVKLLVAAHTHGGINDIGCRLVKLQHLFKRSNKRELRLVKVGSFECTHPGLQAHCIDNLVKYNLERNKEELFDTEIRFFAIENDIAKLRNLLTNCKPHSDEISSAQRKVDKLLLERRQLQKKLGYLKTKMNIDEEKRKASMRLEILENADIILTTIQECRSSVLVSAYSGASPHRFKCCLVDDATQLTELELLTLLLHNTQKLVLFGDTQQLIPKVKSIASREFGYQLSYFERCQLYFQKLSDVPPCNFCVLREQFRMNSDICAFSSSYFYGDKVITPPNIDKSHRFPKLHSCVIFDIADGIQSMDMLNVYNLPEAQFIIKIISELSTFNKCRWNIGIITSCWGQCDILQKLLTNDIKIKHNVEIGTVEYFQGHEKDVIILSCVQTKHREGEKFLSCSHLFNLAITRSQKLLIVCGSAVFLQEWMHWKMFIQHVVRKKTFFRTKSTSTNIMLHLINSGHN